jgi:glycosyltransferase 2 family protein
MQPSSRTTRRTLLTIAKFALAIAILSYLGYQVYKNNGFTRLWEQQKNWPLLAAAVVCTFTAILLNFIRWHFLIRAVGIDIRLRDTTRYGALGYALNFVAPGSIGGDLFKAIFLAHGQPGRRTEAVATVLADRLLGVTTILVIASIGILATGVLDYAGPTLTVLCNMMLIATLVGVVGGAIILFIPATAGRRITGWTEHLPVVGSTAGRLLGAVRAFRGEKRLLLAAGVVSVFSNLLFITSVFLVASGLPLRHPNWADHIILVPIANIVAAMPITPAGLGAKEFAVEKLYTMMPSSEGVVDGNGTLVTLGHRVTEMTVALLGLLYILTHRAEVREAYAEVEEMVEGG